MIQLEKFKSGHFEKHPTGYTFFNPSLVNSDWTWEDQSINVLLERAAVKLGELNSYARLVPNIDLFIQLHVTKEAVDSSRIEGTQTQMDEALLDEEDVNPERRDDWMEVRNYSSALNFAIKELEQLPISSRLIKATHRHLLSSVRGEHKLPGEFRSSQNWIGGASLLDAVFIPPHHELIPELMSDLGKFLHNDHAKVPSLIKIGIAHYQFETIHPFLDGNGRIGRLLITLFLVDQKIMEKPLLYLSTYFERNRGLYYDNLTNVRTKNDMIQWLKYFLNGVAVTAEKSSRTLNAILELKARHELQSHKNFGKRSVSATILMHHLFKRPVIQVNQAEKLLECSYKAANDLISDFVQAGILVEKTGQSRNRIFVFEEYLELFKND